MPFCASCGSANDDAASACASCGQPLAAAAPPPPPPFVPGQGLPQAPPVDPYAPPPPPPGSVPPGYGPPPGAYGAPPAYGAAGYGPSAAYPGPLASWGKRLGGLLIDGLIGFAVALVIGVLAAVAHAGALSLLGDLINLGLLIWFGVQIGATGQSPGMRLIGLKCVHKDTGQVIGSGLGVVRWLATFLNTLICYVGWFFPLWDANKQTLADKVMSTVVCEVPSTGFSLAPPK